MIELFFQIAFLFFGVFFVFFARNEKDYLKCKEDNGEEFANKRKKIVTICGYLLLSASCLWILIDILTI